MILEPQAPLLSQKSSASFSDDSSVSISEDEACLPGTLSAGGNEVKPLCGISQSSLEIMIRVNELCEYINEELQYEHEFHLHSEEADDLKKRILEVFHLNEEGYLDLGSMACVFELDLLDESRCKRLACFNVVAEIYDLC